MLNCSKATVKLSHVTYYHLVLQVDSSLFYLIAQSTSNN